MKLITRDTDYALRALGFIFKNKDKLISTTDLVKKLKIPRPFLRKILQVLNKKGVLKSYRGKGGGFVLAIAADKIFLSDLIEIFQGHFEISECLFKKRACPNKKNCTLKSKMDTIEEYVFSQLKSITLASL
jgi:Rrf2 family protein